MTFKLTAKQVEANRLLGSAASNIMLRGGSRSGKTFLIVRAICIRAMKSKGSRHAIWRFRFNHAKASIWKDTMPKVMSLCFPNVPLSLNETDLIATFPNGSEIWLGGLDDKARVEKVLGQEYASLYFNESSQIPWSSVETSMSRLAQKTDLALKAYFDCVSGDTILDGQTKTIAELEAIGESITVVTTHGPRVASAPWINGVGAVYTLTTNTGRKIRATASHRFWTPDGWERLDALTIGHEILCIDERHSPRDDLDDLAKMKTRRGSKESCCICRHQYDGQSRLYSSVDPAYPASSFDEVLHNPCSCRRDELGSHTVHQHPLEVRHNRHTQSCRELLSQASDFLISYIRCPSEWRIYGLFRRIFRFSAQYRQEAVQTVLISGLPAIDRYRLPSAWYLQVLFDAASIGKQWLRCNLLWLLSPDQIDLRSTPRKSLSLASDTPIIDGHKYETVAGISEPTVIAYYTVDVPFYHHYLASGFVSHNCNPPSKLHWSYELFRAGLKPGTKERLPNPSDYAEMQMNPEHNRENLPEKYFDILAGMSEAKRLRFERGEWASEVAGALWSVDGIDATRVNAAPEMQRIVVAVDPSGTKGDGMGDDIGIIVAGLGVDGRAYVLADRTCQMSPSGWGRRAVDAYREFGADRLIAERNFGGAMVEHVIKTVDPLVSYREVTASRGKVARAEPVSALYEKGLVSHVGSHPDLEDQMCSFTPSGYVGEGSPDRADALVWALTELVINGGTYDASMGWV